MKAMLVKSAMQFSDQAVNSSPQNGSQPCILIVDDEPNVLKSLSRLLQRESFRLLEAGNAQQALALLEDNDCQLVISDYMMPGMNGADLLRRIKQQFPRIIRMVLTGHHDTEAVMSAVKDGSIYKFLLKPWNDDDLRVSIFLALDQFDLMEKNRNLLKENQQKNKELDSLSKIATSNRCQLAIMLIKRGVLNEVHGQEIYAQLKLTRKPVIRLLLENNWVTEQAIRKILRDDFLMEEVNLLNKEIDPAVATLLQKSTCFEQYVVPLEKSKNRLTLVMADPMNMGLIDEIRYQTQLEITPVMANVDDINAKLTRLHGHYDEDSSLTSLNTFVSAADPCESIEIVIDDECDDRLEDLLVDNDEPPAIRLVNAIILEAIRLGASDIHIHPRTSNIVVRYRVDGVMHDKIKIPLNWLLPVNSRIKIMSELDITERRRPQDGRITVKTSLRVVDLRISCLPTINGEKIVMRLLDRNSAVVDVDQLGVQGDTLHRLKSIICKPQGIILATGPTGSGKTTSLYSMLQYNASSDKNYVTIEDPVEYYLDMAGQVLVKEKIGLDFASVLRSVLRQDPDVILLGEIRDQQTAEVAFHAALTGHLVFSTLHTNSAVATIARLIDLGLKPYVIASALEAILAQRLLRTICRDCQTEYKPDPDLLKSMGREFMSPGMVFLKGTGCSKCNGTGYSGRIGVYEILVPDSQIRHLIAEASKELEIEDYLNKTGLNTMISDAIEKMKSGLTTPEEIFRVFGPQGRI